MLTVGCVRYLLRNRLRRRRRRPRLLLLALPGLDLLDELGGVLREVDLHSTPGGTVAHSAATGYEEKSEPPDL